MRIVHCNMRPRRFLLIALIWCCLIQIGGAGRGKRSFDADDAASNDAGSGDESLFSAATGMTCGLTALAVVCSGKARECKMCGCLSDQSMPDGKCVGKDNYGGFWPWLHYVRVCEATKRASGKLCLICHCVFTLTSLKPHHGCIATSLIWKNKEDSTNRHNPFMRAYRKYLALLSSKRTRLHARRDI